MSLTGRAVSALALALGLSVPVALGIPLEPEDTGAPTPAAPAPAPEAVGGSILGVELPSAPRIAPGPAPLREDPTLAEVRMHLSRGDEHRALRAARALVSSRRWGRDRDAAWMVIGILEREAGHANRASEAFTHVRSGEGPLAPWGAWYEAEQDLVRGRPWVAVRECERYREAWPEGHHADACLRLTARAYATNGKLAAARRLAEEYDDEHDDAPITEQVELAWALWAVDQEPEAARSLLRDLAVTHQAPLTSRVAEEQLALLDARGIEGATVPDDTSSLQKRAISLRDARRRHEAWAAYTELRERAVEEPDLQRWVDQEAAVFGWRTRSWDFLVDTYKADYEDEPTGENAWRVFRALGRAGRWHEASDWAVAAQERHGATRYWHRAQEEIGHTHLLAGRYELAREAFETVRKRGGWTGRRGAFFAGFAAYMAGDHEDAVARLTALIDMNRSNLVESHYWRARALQALDRGEEAQADVDWILTEEPRSWYAVLLQQGDAPEVHPFARDGRWPGPALPPPPEPHPPHTTVGSMPIAVQAAADLRRANPGFALLRWGAAGQTPPRAQVDPPLLLQDLIEPPASYTSGLLYSERETEEELWRYTEEHGQVWTDLPAAFDLARAGLYDLSGPLFAGYYEDWKSATRSRSDQKRAAAQEARVKAEEWRSFFFYTRDHNHTARFTYDLYKEVEDPDVRAQIERYAYPLAHDRYVWSHARKHGIDPYLVMGLMRTESVYNSLAVSRAGARGAMQIMPRTGHLLANLAHDTDFTAGDLDDPVLSVGYGITYLGLLMERYDDAFPMAIASYNAGPHNVAAWLEGTGYEMPMDAFVEHIPFRETRNYVKQVSGNYATYLDLYAPEGTAVRLPEHPRGNHPEIVDF